MTKASLLQSQAFNLQNYVSIVEIIGRATYDWVAIDVHYRTISQRQLSEHFFLKQLGEQYEVLRDQRYDLSNRIIWARDGGPGGIGRFTPQLGADVEESYKKSLISCGKFDILIGMIRKDGTT